MTEDLKELGGAARPGLRQAFSVPVRSVLVVPASDETAVLDALDSGADAVVADLEDLVPVDRKTAARAVVRRLFAAAGPSLLIVRVNASDAGLPADLDALQGLPLDAVMVPKADLGAVHAAAESGHPLLALVETANGVRLAYELACHESVVALAIGIGDLSADLGLPGLGGQDALQYARSKLVVDSAAAGAAAPYDVPSTHTGSRLRDEAAYARGLGFGGKICRSAEQVTVVNEVFAMPR